MEFKIVRLYSTNSPFRVALGNGQYSQTPLIHSDTMWGNLIWSFREVWGADGLHGLFNAYQHHGGQPPMLISSALPFAGDLLFSPVPHSFKLGDREFISKGLLEEICRGDRRELMIDTVNIEPLMRGTLTEAKSGGTVYTVKKRQHLTKGQSHGGSQWSAFDINFADGAGFFFLVQFSSDEWEQKFTAALNYLAQNGAVGADKNMGCGRVAFRGIETVELDVPEAENADGFLSLSLASPEAANLNNFAARGEQVTRQGWIHGDATGAQKQLKEMWLEGAFFAGQPAGLTYGQLLDVRPECFTKHPVYLYAYPFPIPCKRPTGQGGGR